MVDSLTEDFDFEIDIRTKPRPFRIGEDRYELIPEIVSSEYLTIFNKFDDTQKATVEKYREKHRATTGKDLFSNTEAYDQAINQKVARDPGYLAELRGIMKGLIAGFLEESSRATFTEKNYPDRVYTTLVNKIVTTYTGRPTESPNGSESQ
ncbi:MAG TPA: hypothetical protein VHK27_03355 [Gammaproteobacteria bacterium]|nr:hypothetical protein [Gammaproteobacteria bacterium]